MPILYTSVCFGLEIYYEDSDFSGIWQIENVYRKHFSLFSLAIFRKLSDKAFMVN